jgi:hypothetical protein
VNDLTMSADLTHFVTASLDKTAKARTRARSRSTQLPAAVCAAAGSRACF